MAEIYRDDLSKAISLGLTGASNISAVITRNGVTVATPVINGDGFTLPFAVVGYDGPFTVQWTFTIDGQTVTRSETHEVVTPYVTVAEIRDALALPSSVTDSQLIRAERQVRKIIDGYTGQSFGRYTGTETVIARGDVQLSLPGRLLSLTSITGPYVFKPEAYDVRGDGYYLAVSPNVPDGDWVFNNVIAAPDVFSGYFKDGVKYTITGVWGWDEVPVEVKEAALILIEQELCPDSEYRNRYLLSVSYADTQFEHDPRAFSGVGNVKAEQLLAPFVRTRLTVI